MEQLSALHRGEYQSEPHIIASAPGKVNLMGEQSEFADGKLLSLAIDRRVMVALEQRSDNYLKFYSADLNERKKSSLTNMKYKREDRWANYLKGVFFSLLQMGFEMKGVNITIAGNIPHSLGLAASTAMELALALALRKLFKLDINDMQLVEAVRLAEYQFMKTDSGISAPLVSMFGQKDHLFLLDSRNLEYTHVPFDPRSYNLLITNTAVPQRVKSSERINFRGVFKTCSAALKKNHMKSQISQLSISDMGNTVDFLSEDQRRFCTHIIEENSRVEMISQLLLQGDFQRLVKLMFRSHESMRDLLEISCPELDWIVKRVQESGPLDGARMIGPGYGGCTIALIHDNNMEEYKAILEEYDRIFGFKAEVFPCRPSKGAVIET
ncbi:MAG: galactokinase [Spirochaetaceae bacterium]|jgi:galactokinase|nr:galactokinase [Spirochaetaceae bacterium]